MSSECYSVFGSSRNEGIQDILDAKYFICQGLDDLCMALKSLRCGKLYEAQKYLVDGIHCIKKGICLLEKELQGLCNRIDHKTLKEIQEGICVIREGIEILCGVLKDICCEQECEAEKCLVKGIRLVKEGLCIIEKALDRLFLY